MRTDPFGLIIGRHVSKLTPEISRALPELEIMEFGNIVSIHSAIHCHGRNPGIKLVLLDIRARQYHAGEFSGRVVASCGKMLAAVLESCLFVYSIDPLVSMEDIEEVFGPDGLRGLGQGQSIIVRTDHENHVEIARIVAETYRALRARLDGVKSK